LADLLDRFGRILSAESVQHFRLGEIEVGAGRLEDVGQGLALGVERLALGDQGGKRARHRGSLVGCAPRGRQKQRRPDSARVAPFLAVGGSYFDRGRAVQKCRVPIYAACGPRARAAFRWSRATKTFTLPQLLQSRKSRGAATRASVLCPTCSM